MALAGTGSSIQPGTDHTVTFGGSGSVTLGAGAEVNSDAVSISIPSLSEVAISFYLPNSTAVQTYHQFGFQTAYVAGGDVSANTSLSVASAPSSYFYLTNLDVQNPAATGAVVTFGASITDGYDSSQNANHRWPNFLAQRLSAAGLDVGVVNEGVSGNQLLSDSNTLSGLHRFQHDAAGQSNARWVVVSDDPINDVGNNPSITGAQLISGVQQLIAQAHSDGLKFLCSTLTPFHGASYWTSAGEAAREQYDAFVLGASSGCDGIVDQDGATHDPNNPTQYLPAYDSGDHPHPNDAGYQAIANAVNLGFFGSVPAGPFGGTPAPIPGTVQNENYDYGGPGVAFSVGATNGSANGYRSDGVDLENTTDPGGGLDVGWTSAGQWFRYTVNVATAGTYTASFRVAAAAAVGTNAGSFHLQTPSGANLSGAIDVPGTGGWQTWTTLTASVALPAGPQVLELFEDTGGYNLDAMTFAAGEAPFGGAPAPIPGTVQNENYDNGGQGVGFNFTSTNGSANGYRSDGVDLENTTDPGGGLDVGWTSGGQWLRYTVNVARAATYTASFRVAAVAAVGTNAGHFHLQTPSGTNLTSAIDVPGTGGWQTWTTITASVPLAAGPQVLELFEDTGGYNLDSMTF
jgi:lysophospholipase L1-like esterase